MYILITTIIISLSELFYAPRFDYTTEGWILLWYGKPHRKYVKIIQLKKGA